MKHPEQKDNEVFITNNFGDESWNRIGWKTKRKGNVAYDSSGNPIPRSMLAAVPVFVQRSEIEAALADPERPSQARALRALLEGSR